MRVTTESCTTYVIEEGFWSRNGEGLERVYKNFCISDEALAWDDVHNPNFQLSVQVGLRMFISSRESWWLSTHITKIVGDDE